MLFDEIKIRNSVVKNRIVMPAMVCHGKGQAGGVVTQKNIDHYALRARHNVGLIIVEALAVCQNGRVSDSQLGIWDDIFINGLKSLVEQCHSHGSKVFAQLHHGGYKTVVGEAISPSDFIAEGSDGKISARGISHDEIKDIQKAYIEAAKRAEKAGFDGVEIQCAHGYFISQFCTPFVNKRTDEYGGSLENRLRFATEVLKGARAACGQDFIIGVRMGGCEPTILDGCRGARIFEDSGADFLNVSASFKGTELPPPQEGLSPIVSMAVEIKKQVSIPVMAVGGITTAEQAEKLTSAMVDMVCIGKGLLCDPMWADKAKSSDALVTCLGCKPCRWFDPKGICPRNPSKI